MSTNRIGIPHVSFLISFFAFAHFGAFGAVSERFYFPPPSESIEKQDRRSPSDVGLKPEVVKALKSQLVSGWESRGLPSKGGQKSRHWALWRHGYLVHVEGDFNRKTEVKSLRKTWHALTVGAAIKQDKIPSIDQKISVWSKELTGKHAGATWWHVMTQTSGFDYPYDDQPAYAPGEMWTYSDKNPKHLCNALARVYGKRDYSDDYNDVVGEAYFDAIGMRGWETSVREDGIRFHFDLEDMGRLGLLVVARGKWQDKELIPEWFVKQLESKHTHGAKVNYDGPDDGRVGLDPKRFPEAPYGFMTWVNIDGDYYPGADRAWAWAAGTGGSFVLWNHKNGIVFAGFGINTGPTPDGIPHTIESCIASDNPLAQGESNPASHGSRVSERSSAPDSVTKEFSSVPLWELFETDLVNYSKYSNPFRDVTLGATFTSPSGKLVRFFGYYDGDGKGSQIGNVWKLRFMPDEIGIWSYTCQFSDGIPGKSGRFTCVDRGAKPGTLRAEGRWLKFANGERFYLRSYYFSEAFSGKSPHWENKVDMLFGGKYNYNFCCTTFWQGRLLAKNRWNNIEYNGFYPIYDEDYTRLDLRSWRHVDEVLQRLESHDAVWFNFDGFVPNVGGDMGQQRADFDAQKVYIRNVAARLAPYWNVTWNIAFEWQEFMSADEVQRLVDFTKQIDPWNHLVTVHDQGKYQAAKGLISDLHVDFVTLQYDAGRCDDAIAANQFIQQYSDDVPVYAQEVCWEADSKLNAEQMRKGAWGVVLAGGLLNYAEMFEGPNQGRPENYGDGKALPQLEIMLNFVESIPYVDMELHNELVGNGKICFVQPGVRYVCYSPLGAEIEVDLSATCGSFKAIWISPRSGKTTNAGKISGGGKEIILCPDEKDWLLYLLREE
jgi:CubicO group peptidase (beta-lactamase class C family)